MKHTEGKLLVLDCREVGEDCISISNGRVVIARIKNEVTGKQIDDEDLANAQRLVACWNEHDDLVKERDELVSMLREFFEKGYSPSRSEKIKKLLKKYPEVG
jgi:hypothetical protein